MSGTDPALRPLEGTKVPGVTSHGNSRCLEFGRVRGYTSFLLGTTRYGAAGAPTYVAGRVAGRWLLPDASAKVRATAMDYPSTEYPPGTRLGRRRGPPGAARGLSPSPGTTPQRPCGIPVVERPIGPSCRRNTIVWLHLHRRRHRITTHRCLICPVSSFRYARHPPAQPMPSMATVFRRLLPVPVQPPRHVPSPSWIGPCWDRNGNHGGGRTRLARSRHRRKSESGVFYLGSGETAMCPGDQPKLGSCTLVLGHNA